ncbi:MAG: MFS transporter [Actinobacteria bacterium]|nr:MFS transporter [Actinomycetota bacterium]
MKQRIDRQLPSDEPCAPFEDVEDAYLEGDRVLVPGTARAALAHRPFRTVYAGAFTSNIGTWMQNVVLGALAYRLTRSAVFVGLVTAAQLGPLLVLSMVGGMLADAVDRKKLLVALTVEQAAFSVVLAAVVAPSHPSKVAILLTVLAIGVGNALYAPAFSAVLPIMVPREDMPGAISLNSVQMNASRVVGPAIGTVLYARFGPSWVFVLNAVSYAAVIAVLLRVPLPRPPASGEQGLHRLVEGVRYARADRLVGRCLLTIFLFSLLSLPFISQMPAIAGESIGINPKSSGYGLLYAAFGAGAVIGALSIGTVFARRDKLAVTRFGFVGFAVLLFVFGLLRAPAPAYPVILVLGAVYFAVITSLSTILQQDLDDAVRGKVMALWIMGFGGIVPFGGLAGGVVIERFGVVALVAVGAVAALGLSVLWFTTDAPAASVTAGGARSGSAGQPPPGDAVLAD